MKKLLLLILVFLFVVAGVNAEPKFNITEEFVNITSSSGATVTASFSVNNTGTTGLNINFTGYILNKSSDQLLIESLNNITNLANNTIQPLTFSVVVPKQQSPGLYTGALTANSNASNADTVTINLNVTPTYDAASNISEANLGAVRLNTTHTKTFNMTNLGNANITNISFSFSSSKFGLKSNKTNFLLPFNQSEIILINITIPAESSTGNLTLGAVRLTSPSLNKDLITISADIGGGLVIDDLDVFLTTRKSKSGNHLDVNDRDKLKFEGNSVGPESGLRFNFNIKNAFSKGEDIDIKDATALVTIKEIDNGEDIEEESQEFDIDAGTNQDIDVLVNIPIAVSGGKYDVLIEVKGEDDNGNIHTAKMKTQLEVSKEMRDIAVTKAQLQPASIRCSGSTTISAEITNIGRRAEEDAALQILNNDLGINFLQRGIRLSEDPFSDKSMFSKEYTAIISKGAKPGTYPIQVRAYIYGDVTWETKAINLDVEACTDSNEKSMEEPISKNEGTIKETAKVKEPEKQEIEAIEFPVLQPQTSTEIPLIQRKVFWASLITLNILVIVSIYFIFMRTPLKGK